MSDDDPFERLDDAVDEREGDPFERLGDAEERTDEEASDAANDTEESTGERTGSDPREEPEPGYDAHDVTPPEHRDELDGTADADGDSERTDVAVDTDGFDSDGPTVKSDHGTATGDPEDPFSDVGTREGDPFEGDVFEQMDTGELDPDDVWGSLSEAEERGSVSQVKEKIYSEVSKHRYCEQCKFFSDPPDVKCGHEGTEILEFIDNETVRVVDCPIVAEREELEKHE